jgi:hypothetical protein
MIWNETEITGRIFEIENDPRVNLKVPEKLINPDPLVVDAKQSLAKKGKSFKLVIGDRRCCVKC